MNLENHNFVDELNILFVNKVYIEFEKDTCYQSIKFFEACFLFHVQQDFSLQQAKET